MGRRNKDGTLDISDLTNLPDPDYSDVEKGLSENGSVATYFSKPEFADELPYGATSFEDAVRGKAVEYAVNRAARQRVDSISAGPRLEFPKLGTVADDLDEQDDEPPWAVEGWLPRGGNALLVAQYKTTLAMNLMKSFADGEPFLGKFPVRELEGTVCFFNYELPAKVARDWLIDIDIQHPEHVTRPWHLRGKTLPFWTDEYMTGTVEWLKKSHVEVWIVDTAMRAARGLVQNENDNTQWDEFTHTLDVIKDRAGVSDLVLTTHMGRMQQEEDNERARGGTRLEDWMDVGLYLSKGKDGRRWLRAMGRDVEQPAIDLSYNEGSRHYRATGQTRDERRAMDRYQAICDGLYEAEQRDQAALNVRGLEDAVGGDKNKVKKWIRDEAEDKGYVKSRKVGNELLYALTSKGRKLAERTHDLPRPKKRRRKRAK